MSQKHPKITRWLDQRRIKALGEIRRLHSHTKTHNKSYLNIYTVTYIGQVPINGMQILLGGLYGKGLVKDYILHYKSPIDMNAVLWISPCFFWTISLNIPVFYSATTCWGLYQQKTAAVGRYQFHFPAHKYHVSTQFVGSSVHSDKHLLLCVKDNLAKGRSCFNIHFLVFLGWAL